MPPAIEVAVKYVAAGGGIFLMNTIFLYFLYVTVRHIVHHKKNKSITHAERKELEEILRASLIMIIVLMSGLLVLGVATNLIDNSPAPRDVIQNSQTLMRIDYEIFSVYPTIWLHEAQNQFALFLNEIAPFIVRSYAHLGALISILLLSALAYKPAIFFRVVIVFSLSVFASLPFWVAFPAVTPNEAFFSNKIQAEIPQAVAVELKNFSPSPYMDGIFRQIADGRNTGIDGYYGITTIPSMHITWSVFVLFYGILLYKKFAYYLVPYFILNAFSTVYLLQHFTLDIVAGLIMGGVLVLLVESSKSKTPRMVLLASKSLRMDIDYFTGALKKFFSRLVSQLK